MFEIKFDDIKRLDAIQLTELLKILLYLECQKNGIFESSASVSLNITVPDGGEDGRIEWSEGIERTSWLPSRLCLFQSKAEKSMTKSSFKKAMLTKSKNKNIQPQMAAVFDNLGACIFFYGDSLGKTDKEKRVIGIREALKEAGRADWDTLIIDIYDANKIADWTNEHLPAVIQVCKWTNQRIPNSFQTWHGWSEYEDHTLFKFVETDVMKEKVDEIREAVKEPQKILRVIGLPGLGKSRLVLQALSEPAELRNRVVYIDASKKNEDLADLIRQHRQRKDRTLFVVDNCELSLHQHLRREITHRESTLSLITIDFDPSEKTGGSDPVICLTECSDSLIRDMLTQVFGSTLTESDLDIVVKFSQGYPLIAALIAKDRKDKKIDAGSLNDDVLLDRLLWGRQQKTEEAFNVISSCALFRRLGYSDTEEEERKLVAKLFAEVDENKFFTHCQHFIGRKIVQKHGDFIMIVPMPLAMRLSADWWRNCSPQKSQDAIKGLTKNLTQALCDQIKMLHYVPEVKELTKNLCGVQGPFGSAEVLNTERGSLLFRAFAVVSPEECVDALTRIFGSSSKDELLEIKEGRRNLVYTLETLCFREETFTKAARLLLKFATAENEKWANNATGQFIELYQLYLPGTMASLEERANLLEQQIETDDTDVILVLMAAAEKAFHLGHFTRSGRPEGPEGKPAEKDYQPKSGKEIHSFWVRCLNILVSGATHPDEVIRNKATECIEHIIYPCIQKFFLDELYDALSKIMALRKSFWTKALQKLDFAVRQSGAKFEGDDKEKIIKLYELLNPKSIEEKINLWVSKSTWDYMEKGEDGKYIDLSIERAKEVAEEFSRKKSDWKQLLRTMATGQQRNGFAFGKEAAAKTEEVEKLTNIALGVMEEVTDEDGNPAVLGGILSTTKESKPDFVSKELDQIAQNPKLRKYLIPLTCMLGIEKADFYRCANLLVEGKLSAEQFNLFAYGSVLQSLDSNSVSDVARKLIARGGQGPSVALLLLHMYGHQDEKKKSACFEVLREAILAIEITELRMSQMDIYNWQESCEQLLKRNHDKELANYILEQMVKVCQLEDSDLFYEYDHPFISILQIILKEPYLNEAWLVIGSNLVSGDWRLETRFQWLLGKDLSDTTQTPGILFSLPDELLVKWARSNAKAVLFLARIVPVITRTTNHSGEICGKIGPLARLLIDEHGDNDAFLSVLSSNIGSFSWTGSETPLYRMRIEALSELTEHPKEKVRTWGTNELEFTKSRLKYSQKRDEEHNAGIFDKF